MQKGDDIITTLIAGTMFLIIAFIGMVSCSAAIF